MFDFDGTLVDSQANIVHCMRAAFAAEKLPPPAAPQIRRIVGLSLELAVEALLPDGEVHLAPSVTMHYREAFFARRQAADFEEPLYEGAVEALDRLARPDTLLGIATGKNLRGLRAALERHGLSHRFVTLQTPDHNPSKPHPGMLLQAMAETGCPPERTLLIGDTTFDMDMAAHASVRALGVAWGYHAPEELSERGATGILRTFRELPAVVDRMLEAE